jgi:hypothetical protein
MYVQNSFNLFSSSYGDVIVLTVLKAIMQLAGSWQRDFMTHWPK